MDAQFQTAPPPRQATLPVHSPQPVLELQSIRLHLGDRLIFDGLDLSLPRGERLVVMGMSGSGKSTLLKLATGTYRPERGSIRAFGKDLLALAPRALDALRMRIGLVFQYGALLSGLTVAENLAFPVEELTEKPAGEIAGIVARTLRFVGLPQTGWMMPHELSGGMQKRIAIARALVLQPELLLLDEPTAGLDPVSSHVINELIIRLNREAGTTVVMIGHKMEESLRVGTQVAILSDGRIVAQGTPAEIELSRHPTVLEYLATIPPNPARKSAALAA